MVPVKTYLEYLGKSYFVFTLIGRDYNVRNSQCLDNSPIAYSSDFCLNIFSKSIQ